MATQVMPHGQRAAAKSADSAALAKTGPALQKEVEQAVQTLTALLEHGHFLGEETTRVLGTVREEVQRRLANRDLCVVVMGETKVGKSTLLNAVLGESILPTAARECTGTVTYLRRAKVCTYRARLRNGNVEDFAQLLPDRSTEFSKAISQWQDELKSLAGMGVPMPGILEEKFTEAALVQARAERQQAEQKLARAQGVLDQHEATVKECEGRLPYFFRRNAPGWAWLNWCLRGVCHRFWARELTQYQAKLEQLTGVQPQWQRACAAARIAQVRHLKLEWSRHHEERRQRFRTDIRALTDVQGRGADVLELAVEYPAAFLPEGMVIIDTPGVNTDNEQNRERAWAVIRRDADGCILLSDLQQVVGQTTKDALREARTVVPHIILILTKMDQALANAADTGDADPWEQVEEARRIGVRRFAKELGRAPDDVFSFAMAAKPVLAGDRASPFTQRFEADIRRLFEILKQERALILGARSATAIRACLARIPEAHTRAEASYRARIDTLEAQRIPDAQEFQRQQIARVEPIIAVKAHDIIESAIGYVNGWIEDCKTEWTNKMYACGDIDDLEKLANEIQLDCNGAKNPDGTKVNPAARVHAFEEGLNARLAADVKQAATDIVHSLLEEIYRRYEIAKRAVSGTTASTSTDLAVRPVPGGDQLAFNAALGELDIGSAIGAVVGAVLAAVVIGISTVLGLFTLGIGAIVGVLFGMWAVKWLIYWDVIPFSKIKSDSVAKLRDGLNDARDKISVAIRAQEADIAAKLRACALETLDKELQRFREWIAGVLKREQETIAAQRTRLQHLLDLRPRLERHDAKLAELMKAAADESQGLCR